MDPVRRKVVIMGASNTGKTSLLLRFITHKFQDKFIPPVIENCVVDVIVDGQRVELLLVDSSGLSQWSCLEKLLFFDADVVLMCFSTVSVNSFERIPRLCAKVVDYGFRDIPIILVGTKKDTHSENKQHITTEAGRIMAVHVSAYGYVECSAKTEEGVPEVFMTAVRATTKKLETRKRHSWFNFF